MKYTIEYCKNNKVAIKVKNSAELKQLLLLFNKSIYSFNYWLKEDCYVPYYNNTVSEEMGKNVYKAEIITFQQFMQSQTKKIIGYKCPISLFNGEVEKGTLFVKLSDTMYEAQSPIKEVRTMKFLPKEIVETWKAVVEDEFKVGDWIYFLKSYDSAPIGHIAKIISLDIENAYQVGLQWLSYSPKQGDGGGFRVGGNGYFLNKDFRKATQEEIDSLFNKTLTLSNGKEVIVKKGVITAQSETVKLEDLIALTQWSPQLRLNGWDISLNVESVNIGCWKKVKISDLELIIKTCQEQIELM